MEPQEPRFVPEQWDALYQSERSTAESFVFSHGADLVVRACANLLPKGVLVVDAGCGSGRVSSRLASLGLRVLAVDRDPAMVRFARRRLAHISNAPVVRLAVADVVALPLADGACDAVVAVSLVGCVPDLRGFLAEVHRILRPGGLALLTVTNRRSPLLPAERVLARLRDRRGVKRESFCYQLHRRDDVTRLLGELDFVLERYRYYNLFVALGSRMFPPKRVALALERLARGPMGDLLARNFLLVVRKPSPASSNPQEASR